MWANFIKSSPAGQREELLNGLPPPYLAHLFKSVPPTAQCINRGYRSEIADLRKCFEEFCKKINQCIAAIEKRCDTGDELLIAANTSINPVEDELSAQLSNAIINCEDVDHV